VKTLLLQNWKFALCTQLSNLSHDESWQPDTDDSLPPWKDVVVPHDWAVTFPFSSAHSSGTGYLPGGTGWYRTSFSIPSDWQGEQVFVHFDGVYKNSQVWCNGYYLGKRPSGYAGFRYDITHCLREGDNIIAVKVSHEDISDSRWYTGSGIYRKAYLCFYDAVYVDDTSLFVRSELEGNSAKVIVSGKLCGGFAAKGTFALTAVLKRKDIEFTETIPITPDSSEALSFDMNIEVLQPELWSTENPNLYTLALELRIEGKPEVLSVTPALQVGIRSIKLDPEKGFFLNGKPTKIKGVCVHHDAGCLGAAVWPEVWRRRLKKLKETGCNAIRMSHNQHMPELYELCDEMGFLVMDEAFDEWEGCKNKWWQGHNAYPPKHQGYAEDFPQWHEEDLAAMVLQNRNHPSVILWSIGNEIDYPNDPYVHPLFKEMTGNNDANKPAAERQYNRNKPNMERLSTIAANLVKIVKKYDTTRPVLVAAAFPELSSKLGFFDGLDVVGYNYKEQLYEEDHKRFPNLPIMGSETGHSISSWKAVCDNDYISAQFLWTGIDYMGEAHGWPIRCSGAGILDMAGNEKIAYFRRKALWNKEPVLYLASRPKSADKGSEEIQPNQLLRNWDYLPDEDVEVVCYTNLDRAELFLNGKSLGTGSLNKDTNYILWTIPFERGTLMVKGVGDIDTTDTLESTLPPVQLSLNVWKPAGDNQTVQKNMFGKYRIVQIEAALLDEKQRLCVMCNSAINITVNGSGLFLGMENGDIADCTEYSSTRRNLYLGRLVIYVLIDSLTKEQCSLTALISGLPPVVVTL